MEVDWPKLIKAKDLKSIEDALKKGADVNAEDKNKVTPLENAIMHRNIFYGQDLDIVKFLVSRGAKVNRICHAKYGKGNSVLAMCIRSQLSKYARYLVSVGANVCAVGKEGKTPLFWAVYYRNIEMIELLLDHGAHFTIPTAFMEAIEVNSLKVVQMLISKGANLNVLYRNGYTLLTRALEVGNSEILKELVEEGAEVNTMDERGNTPLINSIKLELFEIARFFIEKGANVNMPDTEGDFPLTLYTKLGNFDLVKTLIEKGANLKVPDQLGLSPFQISLQEDHFEIAKYFVEKGEDVNQVFENEETPLSIAASKPHYQLFQFLVDSGADINLANEKIKEVVSENEDFDLFVKTIEAKNEIKETVFVGSGEQEAAS